MRLILLTLAAALAPALTTCGAPADRNQAASAPQPGSSSGDPAVNEAAPAAPKAVAPAPAEPMASIPAAFHGAYDQDRESCGRASEYRLNVTADALRFHESVGTVRAVTVAGPNEVDVVADYEGEGESWTNRRRLRLKEGRLTISGEGIEIVRLRCP